MAHISLHRTSATRATFRTHPATNAHAPFGVLSIMTGEATVSLHVTVDRFEWAASVADAINAPVAVEVAA